MQAFQTVTGPAAQLLMPNIDTDVIIRIERLTSLEKHQLGPYAFEALRYDAGGGDNPLFPLNQPAFRRAPILICGVNFGCGSSREGAVWALQDIGVRCVIAPSFGDIFFNNCYQNGVLPIRLAESEVTALAAAAAGGAAVTVDLRQQAVLAPDGDRFEFQIDALRRDSLLEGLDDIGLTLKHRDAIMRWEAEDAASRPWIYLPSRAGTQNTGDTHA